MVLYTVDQSLIGCGTLILIALIVLIFGRNSIWSRLEEIANQPDD